MIEPIKGGSSEDVQGLICHIPPVPAKHLIAGFDLPKKDQMWRRTELPEDWDLWREEEEIAMEEDPEYVHPKIHAFVAQEWDRRLNGYWFYNNGKPTYITGKHYFYVNWWKLDSGYPDYRDTDRLLFYFWQYCIEDPNCYGMVELTARRQGKCFARDTKIRMYDGSVKPVQDIQDGELVMGNDSTPRKVFGAVRGREEMFKIVPNKGDGFVCNKSHTLTLFFNNNRRNVKRGWEPKSFVNISVEDYLKCTANEKDHLVLVRSGWGNHFQEEKHLLSPYFLGLWLGNRCKYNTNISTNEPEVLEYLNMYTEILGLVIKRRDKYTYALVNDVQDADDLKDQYSINYIRSALRSYGLFKNKHIPREYLIDSLENRFELLAGLLDTDGYLNIGRNGHPCSYEIVQKEKELAYGIVELSRSLGFYTSVYEKIATMKRDDGSVYRCLVYRICIYGEIERIPCKVERRKAKTNSRRVNSLRTGFKVESIGEDDYYGFSVDGNNLFLLADGMIVHNSYRATSDTYEEISRPPGKRSGGMQSKTGDDAEELFREKLIEPWKDLPDFFKPESDSGSEPKSELRFFAEIKRGKKAKRIKHNENEELRSFIDWKNAKEVAYDGKKKFRLIHDEAAKVDPKEADPYRRWEVCKPILKENGRIAGKMYMTTTVEEMEKGGIQFKKIWDDSDHTSLRSDVGETKSGLYRYFLPAHQAEYYNQYGIPASGEPTKEEREFLVKKYGDRAKHGAKAMFESVRKSLEFDPKALYSYQRKFPFTPQEAFYSDVDQCEFNAFVLGKRKEELQIYKNIVTQGDFVWANEKDGDVRFVHNSVNGKFKVFHIPDPHDQNRVSVRGYHGQTRLWRPNNIMRFTIGVDPVDHGAQTSEGKKSNAAAYVFRKFDMNIDAPDNVFTELDLKQESFSEWKLGRVKWKTNIPVVQYIHRYDDPRDFYEDMIKLARFYGCKLLIESQKPGLLNHMKERGYEEFIMNRPSFTFTKKGFTQDTQGIASSTPMIQQYTERISAWVQLYGHLNPFIELNEDLLKFNPSRPREHDPSVAFGFTLIAAENKDDIKRAPIDINDIFRSYPAN